MARQTIGKVRGRFCAIGKKELRAYACSQKKKCRAIKAGKAVIGGKVRGIVYCCKPIRHRRRKLGRSWKSYL